MRVGFSSNPDWQNEYIGNSLIDDCHIWQTVVTQFIQSKKEHLILPWEVSSPSTSLHKDIMLYRQEKHIGNGISICSQDESSREYFALCPMINDKNFLKHAIANMFTVKYNLMKFRKIRINAFDKIAR